jgi:hypothetical protein
MMMHRIKFRVDDTRPFNESQVLAYKTTSHNPVVSTIVLYVTTAARPRGQENHTNLRASSCPNLPVEQVQGDKVLALQRLHRECVYRGPQLESCLLLRSIHFARPHSQHV